MSQVLPAVAQDPVEPRPIVNDFCITFSTINGSGSATANTTLLRALFKMGIPVSGKNIFPSNIQGLPTWYSLRLNKKGFLARVARDDIVVTMNPATVIKEQEYVLPGGAIYYADDIKIPQLRTDIVYYPMPVKQLVKSSDVSPKLRDYIANMVYVGVLAQHLGIDLEKIRLALDFHFKGKKSAVDTNMNVIQDAYDWTAANLTKHDPYRVEAMPGLDECILADGNSAAALGAIFGGVQFAAWYPITPASSLAESLNEFLPSFRVDPVTGKNTYVVVQAEDELAAIGMTVGAGWAGLRSMTSTSGPGLSLMAEYLGLAYYSETPLVLWDIQRVGPSTGLPTRTQQGDITFANYIGHGDTQTILLFPGSVKECFEFGWQAFDLAEQLQTPVIVLSDLDLGMNQWMSDRFEYPNTPMQRGKVLWEEDLKRLAEEGKEWGRYLDMDGDGIPYRTLPGNTHPKAAWFARGTGHDEFTRYSEDPDVWEKMMARLKRKFETARSYVPKPVVRQMENARYGILSCGSTDFAIEESRYYLAQEGMPSDYMRIKAIPFTQEVVEFIKNHDRVYVIELNRDGQLHQLLSLEDPSLATRLVSVSKSDGLPLTAEWIQDQIKASEVQQ